MADPAPKPTSLWQLVKGAFKPAAPVKVDLPSPDPKAFAIKEVIAREGQQIRALCARRDVRDRLNPIANPGGQRPVGPAPPERFGLAFSGGGIRSAAVNLGLVQSLARSGFLRQAHYISGVSGGGYILGWLTAWTARVGFDAVEDQLSSNSAWPNSELPNRPGFRRYLEPNPIHYLRRYVSYLVPRSGLGSGDTLAAATIYLRNLLLVQTMVASALICILALLQMAAPSILWPKLLDGSGRHWLVPAGETFLGMLALVTWYALDLLGRNADPEVRRYWATIARVCGFCLCLAIWLGLPAYLRSCSSNGEVLLKSAFWIAGFYALEFAIALVQTLRFGGNEVLEGVRPQDAWWARVLAAIGAAALGALLLAGFRSWLNTGDAKIISMSYVILGLPSILLAASLISFFQLGLFGDAFPDAKREWLGRLAGYFLYFAGVAGIVMFVTLQGTACMEWMFVTKHPAWVSTITKWVLPGGWIATTVGGLFAARSSKTGKDEKDSNNGSLEALAAVAPSVFLFGLMLLLSWATYLFALHLDSGDYLASGNQVTATATAAAAGCSPAVAALPNWIGHLLEWLQGKLSPPALALMALSLLSGGLACLLGWRVSVNEFSLHLFYRNRLTRTFLGASNINAKTNISVRKPDPFTGFTLDDDHYLGSLRQGKFDGPYPMWCTSLNLTGGEDLAWQQRKASSFIYSPLFCGWDYMPSSTSRKKGNAYREVAACTEAGESSGEGYGGKGGAPLIGTAMAASGAAISPNWGFHTKPSVAALLAIFNVRIGWWAGNPLDPKGCRKYAPGIGYFLSELLGSANENREYVYLSDGGNFENLGVYELVRRRVKYIIVCDADSDPDYEFGDLANAIEKCRVDFGVQIEMNDYTKIAPDEKTRRSATHYAIGIISYLPQTVAEQALGTAPGVLLYIKSSITGDEPAQVLGQQTAGSRFPHDETLNQFFNETQFEAYRALGEHMGTFLETRYSQFLAAAGVVMPEPRSMAPEQRADCVRMFFESFLMAARVNPALLS